MALEQFIVLIVFGIFALLQWMARHVAARTEAERAGPPEPSNKARTWPQPQPPEPALPAAPVIRAAPAGVHPTLAELREVSRATALRALARDAAKVAPRPSRTGGRAQATSSRPGAIPEIPRGRRALQHAIVLSTVLGPPRALDPGQDER